jgi:Tfp pilus assembly protein PilV
MLTINYKPKTKSPRGFTLIEALVSMFIFIVTIAAVSQLFAKAFSAYNYEKATQKDLESAQFAMNAMAKSLRTSTVASVTPTAIKFFDYSQGICFRYAVNGGNLEMAQGNFSPVNDCGSYSLQSQAQTTVVSGVSGGGFTMVASSPGPPVDAVNPQRVGKVTMYLQVKSGTAAPATIQTSVSLRDYGTAGL